MMCILMTMEGGGFTPTKGHPTSAWKTIWCIILKQVVSTSIMGKITSSGIIFLLLIKNTRHSFHGWKRITVLILKIILFLPIQDIYYRERGKRATLPLTAIVTGI